MLRPAQALLLVVAALLVFGVVMVNSAGLSVRSDEAITLERVLLSRSTVFAGLALTALVAGSLVPVRRLYLARGAESPIPWLVVGMVCLLFLAHVPGIGRQVNGAWRWISIGGVSFQPSEFAKWALLIVLAWHCARRAGSMHRLTTGFLPPMALVCFICAFVALEDLGTSVLIGLVSVAVLVTAGSRLWQAALVIPIGIVGFVAALVQAPYRIARLLAYVNPFDDPQGIGYHIIQSITAVSSGGLAGRGLGNGVRKFGYLPEDTTDFIFAIICEELGIFGAAFVVCLYAALLTAGYMVIRRVTHAFERLLAIGILLTIGFQALINIAVVTGVAPTKGIALPLLSHGGTGWVLTAFSIGLLIAMDRAAADGEGDSDPVAVASDVRPAPAVKVISIGPGRAGGA